ncbi:MAG: DUF5067 domain-containing protein [Lachnospiraceae bacterium]|nr:DUF5067 domain-containing protein [Lachnospiraceae bacterium]
MSRESADNAKRSIVKERTVKKRAARSIVAPRIDEESYSVTSSKKDTIFIPGSPKPVKEKPSKVIASPVNVLRQAGKDRLTREISAPRGVIGEDPVTPTERQGSRVTLNGTTLNSAVLSGTGWPDRPPTPRPVNKPESDSGKEADKKPEQKSASMHANNVLPRIANPLTPESVRAASAAERRADSTSERKEAPASTAASSQTPSNASQTAPSSQQASGAAGNEVKTADPGHPRKLLKTVVTTTTTTYESVTDEEFNELASAVKGDGVQTAAVQPQPQIQTPPEPAIPAKHPVQASPTLISVNPGNPHARPVTPAAHDQHSAGSPVNTVSATQAGQPAQNAVPQARPAAQNAPAASVPGQQPANGRPQQPSRPVNVRPGQPSVNNGAQVPGQPAAAPAGQPVQNAAPQAPAPQARPAGQPVQNAAQQGAPAPQARPAGQPVQNAVPQGAVPQARPAAQQGAPALQARPAGQPVQNAVPQGAPVPQTRPAAPQAAPAAQQAPVIQVARQQAAQNAAPPAVPQNNESISQTQRQLHEIEKALGLAANTTQIPLVGQGQAAPQAAQQAPQSVPAAPAPAAPVAPTPAFVDEQTKKAAEYLMLGVECLVFVIVLCVLISIAQKIKKMGYDGGRTAEAYSEEYTQEGGGYTDDPGTESFDVEQAGMNDEIPVDGQEITDALGDQGEVTEAPSGSVDVDNDNFTLRCTNVTVKLDSEGNPAALIYFTFTNKTGSQLAMSDVFPPSVTQNGEPCETSASLDEYPDEFYNKDMQISDGASIDCCYAISLKDAVSPIRLTIYDNYESFSDVGSTEIALQ